MSNKEHMMQQGNVQYQMTAPVNVPSYEEAMSQQPQAVMIQPQPVFNPVLNAQPGYPQPGYPQPGYPQQAYPPGFDPQLIQPIRPIQPQMQPIITQYQSVGPVPTRVTCPSCKYEIETKVEYVPALKTHIFASLLCLFGCWCCVCCPYCIDSCQATNHNCPNCGAFIGTYNE